MIKDRTTVYHVMNRTVRKHFWLDDVAKEVFRRILRKQAAFSGVEILTYCLMNNHFHLLIRVPECPLKEAGKHLLSDGEILARYSEFYGTKAPVSTYSVAELKAAFDAGGEVAETARRTVLARMGDLSAFMKELKQRFAVWFNVEHDNRGTIWAERFKSVIVESKIEVLTMVGAYVDLNPVRAALVSDPKDYRWSGYGEAMGGSKPARCGLAALLGEGPEKFGEVIAVYRLVVYGEGGGGRRGAGAIDPAVVRRVVAAGGKVSVAEALRCRLREFSDSVVLGSEEFVAECQRLLAGEKGVRRSRWTGLQQFRKRFDPD